MIFFVFLYGAAGIFFVSRYERSKANKWNSSDLWNSICDQWSLKNRCSILFLKGKSLVADIYKSSEWNCLVLGSRATMEILDVILVEQAVPLCSGQLVAELLTNPKIVIFITESEYIWGRHFPWMGSGVLDTLGLESAWFPATATRRWSLLLDSVHEPSKHPSIPNRRIQYGSIMMLRSLSSGWKVIITSEFDSAVASLFWVQKRSFLKAKIFCSYQWQTDGQYLDRIWIDRRWMCCWHSFNQCVINAMVPGHPPCIVFENIECFKAFCEDDNNV